MSEIRKPDAEEQILNSQAGIGEQLRAQRKSRGITLVEVSEHTKIGKRYLEAMEDEKFDLLPGATYIQGFLRAYAKYLELDDEKMVFAYKAGCGASENACGDEISGESTTRKNNQSLWMPVVSMIILAGMGAGIFLLWPGEKEKGQMEQEIILPQTISENIEQITPPLVQANDTLSLKIRAKEKTWITLMIDGKQAPDVTLAVNEERNWEARDRFVLWTGNAGGIEVHFNGELQGPLGKKGEVRKEIIFERKLPAAEPASPVIN